MNQAIVVGVDDSDASRAALRWAAHESMLTGHPLHVLHTWQLNAPATTSNEVAGYAQAAAVDARARATRWVLEALGEDAARYRWTLELVQGGLAHAVSPVVAVPR